MKDGETIESLRLWFIMQTGAGNDIYITRLDVTPHEWKKQTTCVEPLYTPDLDRLDKHISDTKIFA